ncbi:uncharacterized protein TNIN_398401 [Trichonephila inaurata madagascariensis]|uniref:Uncharacterized protein n=1 Tax=Trichonephila inaurata madagascariensis TaxID=2747483 RepID=A0A8X6X9Y0_9ARAC|nr:uncharacterized protein TNIN_398401 [Trichonephila inaurata madagascariensis]
MFYQSTIYLICKISPIFDSITLEKYVLTKDFYLPLRQIKDLEENEYSFVDDLDSHNFSDASNSSSTENDTNINICSCIVNAVTETYARKIIIKLDALLFSIISCELKNSQIFRSKVLSNFYAFSKKRFVGQRSICPLCQRLLFLQYVKVYLYLPTKNIVDYKWNDRIKILVHERCELENAMAWLSTLGGAFSALGDYFTDCAEKAGLISLQQFSLALRLGDPLTICRCKIYLAMSMLQRGYHRKAKKMIRELYKFSVGSEGSKDFRLKNMCLAVWNRLKYEKSKKAISSGSHKANFTSE